MIRGVVSDSAGLLLSGVNIFVAETDYGTATGTDGKYVFNNLRPGKYTLQFSMVGYKKETREVNIVSRAIELNVILSLQPVESKQVVITAAKHRQVLEDLSESAEIISGETFAPRNYITLEDAVRYVPGVIMTDDQMSIRGSTGYSKGAGTRVLLAVDGIPMYQGDTGEIIWESIPLNEIERIEVLKGASSSIYGSTAIGGVVNVITRRVQPGPSTQFSVYGGAYDKPYYKEWDWSSKYRLFNGLSLSHSNNIGNLGFTVSLKRQQDNGYRQDGYFTRYIGYLKTIYNFSPSSTLQLLFNSVNQNSGNFLYWKDSRNTLIPPDADQGQKVVSNRYMLGIIYKQLLSSSFFFNFRSGYYNTKWEDQSTGRNSSLSQVFRNELQGTLSIGSSTMLIAGIENSLGKTEANLFGNRSSFGAGVYAELEYKFAFPLTVSGGVRYDYNKVDSIDATDAVSPKAGINYKLTDNLIFRSSVGRGFRAPSLAETFASTVTNGITIRPNPNLKPETSTSFEVGALYKINEHIYFDAALFQNEFYDFIEPELRVDESGSSYGVFDNITRARIQGFEFKQDYYFLDNALGFSASYAYLWARDLNTGKALKYRPRHMALININYKFLNFETGIGFRYSSRVDEVDSDLIKYTPIVDGEERVDVYVLDFSLGYNLFSYGIPGRVFLNAKNLLNYYYIELIGNLAPLRSYSINAEFFF